jgi:hypothetical protein
LLFNPNGIPCGKIWQLAFWPEEPHFHAMQTLRLRAVIYPEDGLWVAHALEMDLIGTGATEAAALRELRSNVEVQLSFAKQRKSNPFAPAPVEIQNLWEETNLVALGMVRSKIKTPRLTTRILEWSDAQVSRLGKNVFQEA